MASWPQRSENCVPLHQKDTHCTPWVRLAPGRRTYSSFVAIQIGCSTSRGGAPCTTSAQSRAVPPRFPRHSFASPARLILRVQSHHAANDRRASRLSPRRTQRPLQSLHCTTTQQVEQHKQQFACFATLRILLQNLDQIPGLAQSVPPNRPLFRSSTCCSRASMFA